MPFTPFGSSDDASGKKPGDVGASTEPGLPGKKDSEDSGSETPEDAMEKALTEGDPSSAIDRLRTCGYKLVKIDDEADDAGGMIGSITPKDRLGAARKAIAGEKKNPKKNPFGGF